MLVWTSKSVILLQTLIISDILFLFFWMSIFYLVTVLNSNNHLFLQREGGLVQNFKLKVLAPFWGYLKIKYHMATLQGLCNLLTHGTGTTVLPGQM